ncbi:MAG: hypothetical protein KIG90_10810, partial [Muribaculaceae bacterium]|nr:hypothetical protein [Muribaculaceae bacterium]
VNLLPHGFGSSNLSLPTEKAPNLGAFFFFPTPPHESRQMCALSQPIPHTDPTLSVHCRWLYLTQIPQISQIFLLIALNLTEFEFYW